jgi:hypothetical protein
MSDQRTLYSKRRPVGSCSGSIVAIFTWCLGRQKTGGPFASGSNWTARPDLQHGIDSAPDGTGEIREPRLYQLIRQKGRIEDHTFEIEFLEPGVQAFSFTFG